MTIGFRAVGTAASSITSSMLVAAPAGVAATDISTLTVYIKPYNITVLSITNNWVKVAEVVNGSVASGSDVGSVRVIVYKKLGTYSDTTVTFTGTVSQGIGVTTAYTKGASELWRMSTVTTGFDATSGANYSATGSLATGVVTGNWLLGYTGTDSNTGTPTANLLAESGATLGSTNLRLDAPFADGDDGRVIVVDANCTAGTGASPPVFTYTNASASSGSTVFVRLQVLSTTLAVTPISPMDDTAGYEITLTGLTNFGRWEVIRNSSFPDVYPAEAVRGGELQDSTTSGEVLGDYEFHFSDMDAITEESLTYTLNVYIGSVLQDSVTSSAQNPVLQRSQALGFVNFVSPVTFIKDTIAPANNITAVIQDFSAYTRGGRILAEHNVLNKRNPIIISDVAGGMEGSFTLLVTGVSTFSGSGGVTFLNKDIEDLLNTGSTYYFQSIFPFVVGVPDFYFKVKSFSLKRLNRIARQNVARSVDLSGQINPLTVFDISFVEVDRPSGLDVSTSASIWGSANIFGLDNWLAVNNANDNWFEVLQSG